MVVIDPQSRNEYKVIRTVTVVDDPGGSPALCRAANGELLLAHSTVWETVPTGGYVKLYRSRDEGRSWSEPAVVARPRTPEWNIQMWSGIHVMGDGSLVMSYAHLRTPKRPDVGPGERAPNKIWHIGSPHSVFEGLIVRSTDHGLSWSEPSRILPERDDVWTGGRPVTAPDGSVLVPLYAGCSTFLDCRDPNLLTCGFVRSTDRGRTWGGLEPIATGPVGYNEVTMGVAANGDIVAILRDGEAGPRRQFRQTRSLDSGRTLEPPRLIEMRGKMPDMLVLPSGRVLLAVGSLDCMDGGLVFSGPANSTYSGLFVSDDHGRTWQRDVLFTSPDLENLIPFDAPVMALLRNGHVLVVSVAVDRRQKDNPLMGWTAGLKYVINQLAPA